MKFCIDKAIIWFLYAYVFKAGITSYPCYSQTCLLLQNMAVSASVSDPSCTYCWKSSYCCLSWIRKNCVASFLCLINTKYQILNSFSDTCYLVWFFKPRFSAEVNVLIYSFIFAGDNFATRKRWFSQPLTIIGIYSSLLFFLY